MLDILGMACYRGYAMTMDDVDKLRLELQRAEAALMLAKANLSEAQNDVKLLKKRYDDAFSSVQVSLRDEA